MLRLAQERVQDPGMALALIAGVMAMDLHPYRPHPHREESPHVQSDRRSPPE